jgi:ATP-binding cassette subfamily B protein RaxB
MTDSPIKNPSPALAPATRWRQSAWQLLSHLGRPSLVTVACVAIVAIAMEICQLLSPLFVRVAIDRVVPADYLMLLSSLMIAFLAIAAVHALLHLLRSRLVISVGERMNRTWLEGLFVHMGRLPIRYFNAQSVGTIAARFWSASYIQRTMTVSFVESILDGVLSLLTFAMIVYLAPALAPVSAVAIFAYVIVRYALLGTQRRADKVRGVKAIEQQSYLWETVAGIHSIKLLNGQDLRRELWMRRIDEMLAGDRSFQVAASVARAMMTAIALMERVVLAGFGVKLLINDGITMGGLFALLAFNEILLNRMFALIDKICDFLLLADHVERVSDLLAQEAEPDDVDEAGERFHSPLSIRLVGVGHSYDHKSSILSGVDLDIAQSECVVITGPSGCGKTTLVKIMLGLIEPSTGTVLINGIPLSTIGKKKFRNSIATVMQEDKLFSGTIAENICFFEREPDEAHIRSCASAVDLHDEILKFESGYQTAIKDDMSVLSSGQRQRLLLARALYRRPAALFLDEATSHLDARRERAFVEYLRETKATRIIISHRPQSMSIADRVLHSRSGSFDEPAAVETE